jgi:hypothetical protein
MLVFPQLQTGANAQYPLARTDVFRTALNSMADGREVKYADTGRVGTRWELRLTGLSDEEWSAVARLHEAVEGRLRTFTLLDPLSNLFQWSEDFEKPEWLRDPMLSVVAGIADPFGGVAAFSVANAGQAVQTLRQTIAGPGEFQYCCSVWGRSVGGASLGIQRGRDVSLVALTGEWKRVFSGGSGAGAGETFSSGFVLGPGASVELYGPQLEAQPAPGAYWRTTDRGGVYAKVRFEEDVLERNAQDVNANAGVLRMTSVE